MDEVSVARSDRRLLEVIGEAMAEAARRAAREDGGSWLACRPGCTECCHGPFPVNQLDASRLREGMAGLAARDPERARAVAGRARAQLSVLREGFPGDPETGLLEDGDEAAEPYFARHGSLPCPALDPETGRCDLYAHRPLSCRTFGPPVRIGDTDLPPCHLCFQGAGAGTVEACRVEPDPHGFEDRIVAGLGEEETLVSFVLALQH